MGNPLVTGIISITLGVIMIANVFMPTLKGSNTSEFTTGELALWVTLGIGGIIGVVYGTFAVFGLV